MEIVTHSPRETQKLGEKISADLKPGSILALYGELGSGKTTFIQGIARGLGIKKRVISPTFVFIRQYGISFKTPRRCRETASAKAPPPRWSKGSTLYHVDLYRINGATEAKGLGLEETFSDKKGIVVIEWADRIKEILPKKRTDIYFEYLGENKRKIKII